MKNYLIITIGTRDVQMTETSIMTAVNDDIITIESYFTDKYSEKESVNKIKIISTNQTIGIKLNTNERFNKYYIFSSPREAGKALVDLDDSDLGWLTFPLISHPVDWIGKKVSKIDVVLTVFTNQDQQKAGFHWKDDTLFFSSLIKRFLQHHSVTKEASFEDFPIEKEPVNVDHQYDDFEQSKGGLLNTSADQIDNIFLLAQGGIDQINTALTLKLMEHFPGKVRYLQQPEDEEVVERKFPRKFLRNLNKAKANELLNRFDFHAIQTLIYDKKPLLLSRMGDLLRNLHITQAQECYNQLLRNKYQNLIISEYWQSFEVVDIYQFRQQLLLLNALVEYNQDQYNELLLRLRTLGEVLLGPNVIEYLEEPELASRRKFDTAVMKINGLSKYLETSLRIDRPQSGWYADAKTLRTIYDFRYLHDLNQKPSELTYLSDCIETVRELRNKLIHSAQPVTRPDIEGCLKQADTTIAKLLEDLCRYLNITGFGIYDTIANEIRALL